MMPGAKVPGSDTCALLRAMYSRNRVIYSLSWECHPAFYAPIGRAQNLSDQTFGSGIIICKKLQKAIDR